MKSKKAVSAVVATVLIILITVAAVSIIWIAVVPMVRDRLNTQSTCFDAVSDLSLVTNKGFTCVESNGNVSVHVARGAKDFNLSDLQFFISKKGDGTSVMITEVGDYDSDSLPKANEAKVFIIGKDFDNYDEIQVAPVVKFGDIEELCDKSATAALKACI
jgi:hypothetical protein